MGRERSPHQSVQDGQASTRDGTPGRSGDRAGEEVLLNLLRTNAVITNRVDRFLRDYGLSMATYNVLRSLASASSDGRAVSRIGLDLVARVPDVTRLVDRLEKLHLVQRKRADGDRRVVQVSITERGREVLKTIDAPLLQLLGSQLGHMTRQEVELLNALLDKARSRDA
jgi:DNA-binding MarR family transcriptional regulator